MRFSTLGAGAAGGLLLLASAAQAQEARHVSVEAQVEVLHDTNVARSSAALAALRGLDRSDTIITPRIAADIFLPVSRQALFLRGSVGRSYYQNNSILSSARYDLNGGARLHLAICEGTLSDLYQHAQTDLQDLTLLATKNVETQNTVALDLTCGRSVGLAPTFSISDTNASNSTAFLRPSDFHTVSTSAGLAYRRPSLGEVSIFGRHDDTTYDHRLVLTKTGLDDDGYVTNAGGVRFLHRTGARIGTELSASYTTVNPTALGLSKFKGFTYRGVVDYRVNGRLTTSAKLERAAQPSIRPGVAYSVTTTAQLDALYLVGSRMKLNAGVSRQHDSYTGSTLGAGDLTDETLTAIYAGGRWDFGRRLAVAATLRHEERDASLAGFGYSSNQAGITLIGKF
jgi:hypothetical protein